MDTVERISLPEENLTIFNLNGPVTKEEVVESLKDYYAKGPVSKYVLWDLTRAELQHIEGEDIQKIAHVASTTVADREGGKAAFVAPDDLAYGLCRIYQTKVDYMLASVQLKVFRDLDAARAWIAEE